MAQQREQCDLTNQDGCERRDPVDSPTRATSSPGTLSAGTSAATTSLHTVCRCTPDTSTSRNQKCCRMNHRPGWGGSKGHVWRWSRRRVGDVDNAFQWSWGRVFALSQPDAIRLKVARVVNT